MSSYNIYGAFIETGEVISSSPAPSSEGGRGVLYRVRSHSREGIETPPLPYEGFGTLKSGDKVYFFLFPDGRGEILPVKAAEDEWLTQLKTELTAAQG